MWHYVNHMVEVPTDCDVRLAVIDASEVHALVFPCRRVDDAWVDARLGRRVEVYPTHWQEWIST
jgi:hypothetical protein